MHIWIYIPSIMAFFWAVMLFCKEKKMPAHNTMSLMMLVFSLAYLFFFNYTDNSSTLLTALTYISLALLVCPIHYCFFARVTDINGVNVKGRNAIVAINLSLIVLTIVLGLMLGVDNCIAMYYHVSGRAEASAALRATTLWKLMYGVSVIGFDVVLTCEAIGMLAWSLFKVYKYDKMVDDYYSNTESKGKKTFYLVVIANFLTVGLILVTVATEYEYIFKSEVLIPIVSALTVLLLIIGWYSYRMDFSAAQIKELLDSQKFFDHAPENDTAAINLSPDVYKECLIKLQNAVDDEKMFLDPDLSLVSLSDKIATNRSYLSRIINFYYGCSFSDYINKRRIEYAKELIKSRGQDAVLKQIAFESGYNSQNSFIRNFTKFEGMDPSAWTSKMISEQ